jgi:hypothetical protein
MKKKRGYTGAWLMMEEEGLHWCMAYDGCR